MKRVAIIAIALGVVFAIAALSQGGRAGLSVVAGGADVAEERAEETPAAPAPDLPAGDAANGQRLFTTLQPAVGMACATCHRVDSDERLIGPGLLGVSARAATRVEGMTAAEYLRTSIVEPGAYVVDGYQNLMPRNWARAFSDAEIDDLVAYLMNPCVVQSGADCSS